MTQPQTEVLVHIGAPSRASGDVKYRCLAQAYLAFEPASRLDFGLPHQQDAGHDASQTPGNEPTIDDSMDFSNMSFQSVWENMGSPSVKQTIAQPCPSQHALPGLDRAYSYVSPTAVIPDSQPVETTKKSASKLGLGDSFSSLNISFIPESQASDSSVALPEEQSPDLSMLRRAGRKRPASPSPSFTSRLPLAKRAVNAQRSAATEWEHEATRTQDEIQSQDLESTQSFVSSMEICGPHKPPLSSSQNNIPSSQPDECGKVMRLNESFLQHRSPERIVVTETAVPSPVKIRFDAKKKPTQTESTTVPRPSLLPPSPSPASTPLYQTSLRILPPEPPVSCDHLDAASLVTEKLAKLARDLDLNRRYRPSQPIARSLRPFERGFWQVSTQSWPIALRQRTWAFLAGFVGRGNAGWGVWCSRDPAPHTWLRLHCFGAVVGHTYLLLYLASQRCILGTGADWLDATCTPTITVSPRKQRGMPSDL